VLGLDGNTGKWTLSGATNDAVRIFKHLVREMNQRSGRRAKNEFGVATDFSSAWLR
jgi:hypothetical protein